MPLVFRQALDACDGFLIIDQLQWCTFGADLQINAVSHRQPCSFHINCIQNLNLKLSKKNGRLNRKKI